MGVRYLPDGRPQVVHHYRRPDGTRTNVSRILPESADKRLIAKTILELTEAVEGSLTSATYKALSLRYRQDRGDCGEGSRFGALETAFGTRRIDHRFPYHYSRFLGTLAGLSVNTVSHYKSVVQRVLSYGYRQGLVDEVPIRDWGIRLVFRKRVWSEDERTRIYNALTAKADWLVWLVRFLAARPCRWQSDARHLTTENLVVMGPDAKRLGPHIRYQPRKTAKRKPRLTYLPLFDRRTGEPFDTELFDYLCHRNGLLFSMPSGALLQNLNTRAWADVLTEAKVQDFHLHDLKHVAITRMLRDEEWSRRELRELGIQYSDRALDVYYHEDAEAVLATALCRRNVEVGREAVNASHCPQHGSNVRPQV